jgi:hypothetical protein
MKRDESMKNIISMFLLVFVFFYFNTSHANLNTDDCEEGHWIESVSHNGRIIELEDGSVFRVDSIDIIYSSLWLPI